MSRPSASLNTAYVDIFSFDALEKKFYKGPDCLSIFCKEIVKTNWYTHFTLPVKAEGQPTTPTYRIPRSVDFNLYNFLVNTTPLLKVKDPTKYRIAWTRNLAHNIIKEGVVTFTDLPAGPPFDSITLDNWSSHMEIPGKWKVYNKMIGNIDRLVNFSSYLPSKPIITWSPDWFEDEGYYLPMNCLRMNEVRKSFTLVDDWTKLLRVEMAVTDATTGVVTWEPQIVSNIVFSDIITGDTSIKMPQFFSQCALVTDAETAFYRKQELEYAIRQFGRYTGKVEPAGPHVVNFTMHNSVRAIFFNALNYDSLQYNIYSNYTTNPTDYNGEDPITTVGLQYDGQSKFDQFPAYLFSDVYPRKHAVRCPQEPGYHLLPYCNKLNSLDPDGSSNFDKIAPTMSFEINDDPEGYVKNEGAVAVKSNYRIEIRYVSINFMRIKGDVFSFPSLEEATDDS